MHVLVLGVVVASRCGFDDSEGFLDDWTGDFFDSFMEGAFYFGGGSAQDGEDCRSFKDAFALARARVYEFSNGEFVQRSAGPGLSLALRVSYCYGADDFGLATYSPFYFRDLGSGEAGDRLIASLDVALYPTLLLSSRFYLFQLWRDFLGFGFI